MELKKDKNLAVFLDRDGVIIKDKHHLHRIEDIEIIPNADNGIKILNECGYLVIVVSNQSVVARGLCSIEEVNQANGYIQALFRRSGAHIDGFYFCPHNPTIGISKEYTRICECRKPKPGMLFQAKKDFHIGNLADCFMIGDSMSDIEAGKAAGCKTILVQTEYGDDKLKDAIPDYVSRDLYSASLLIQGGRK